MSDCDYERLLQCQMHKTRTSDIEIKEQRKTKFQYSAYIYTYQFIFVPSSFHSYVMLRPYFITVCRRCPSLSQKCDDEKVPCGVFDGRKIFLAL
jgi:hypothetical protein